DELGTRPAGLTGSWPRSARPDLRGPGSAHRESRVTAPGAPPGGGDHGEHAQTAGQTAGGGAERGTAGPPVGTGPPAVRPPGPAGYGGRPPGRGTRGRVGQVPHDPLPDPIGRAHV